MENTEKQEEVLQEVKTEQVAVEQNVEEKKQEAPKVQHRVVEESENYLRLNFTYACFLTKSMYTKIIKTTSCEKTVANAAPLIPNPKPILPKSSSSKRLPNEVGISSIRGGNTVGEHTLLSYGSNENISITHEALSRSVFASGSIELGLKLINKKNGFFSVIELL